MGDAADFMKTLVVSLAALAFAPGAAGQTSAGADPNDAPSSRNSISPDWQRRIDAFAPAPGEVLYVLVHSAPDCPYCEAWKRDPAGLAAAKKLMQLRPTVRFHVIDRDSLRDSERRSDYPEALLFEYERRAREGKLSPPVPSFSIFLRGQTVYRTSGLAGWREQVLPAIVQIEKRRPASAAPLQSTQ